MKCDSFQQEIPLYVYGELPAPAEELFEEHLAICGKCAGDLKSYRKFSDAVSSAVEEPPVWLLAECRQSLSQLTREAPKRTHTSGWKFNWEWLLGSSVAFKMPVGAMALLAVGFFAARLLPTVLPSVGSASSSSSGGVTQAGLLTNIRSVQPDSTGRVQIDVDETNRRVYAGSVDDPKIQKLLLLALQDESDAGVRVESTTALKDRAGDPSVRRALLDAVVHDPNPGVRMRALDGLKSFEADPEIRKSLSQVLMTDDNAGVRMRVIDLLTSQKSNAKTDDALVAVLQQLVQKDDNSYIQQKCQRALQDRHASVGTF